MTKEFLIDDSVLGDVLSGSYAPSFNSKAQRGAAGAAPGPDVSRDANECKRWQRMELRIP